MNGSTIAAIVIILIGVAALIAGIAWYEYNNKNSKVQSWGVWVLMFAGLVVAVLAAIWLAFSLRSGSSEAMTMAQVA